MTDPISAIGLEATQAATSKPAVDPQASSHDIRDFAAAMERNGGGAQSTTSAADAPATVQATQPSSEGLRTLLTSFDRLNGGAESIREVANKLNATGTDFSPSEVIQLTMKCHEFMFQSQLTSNVANRTSDGIQQLFRQQS